MTVRFWQDSELARLRMFVILFTVSLLVSPVVVQASEEQTVTVAEGVVNEGFQATQPAVQPLNMPLEPNQSLPSCQTRNALLEDLFKSTTLPAAESGCESTCTGYCGYGGCCACFCGGVFNLCYYWCCQGSPEALSASPESSSSYGVSL